MEKDKSAAPDEKIYQLLEIFSKLPNDKKDAILEKASVMCQETLNSSQSKRRSDLQ